MNSIEKQIEILKIEQGFLINKKRPLDDRLLEIYHDLERLNERLAKKKIKNIKEPDVELILTANHKSMILYKEAERQIHNLGLSRSGYYPEIDQVNIELKMEGDNLEQTYNSIMLLLPYMKHHLSELFKDKKVFGIFEHTLSEFGIYNFAIADDGTCTLIRTTYGHQTVEEEFDTILDGLRYIQEHHYY